jgi:hypothetical protein
LLPGFSSQLPITVENSAGFPGRLQANIKFFTAHNTYSVHTSIIVVLLVLLDLAALLDKEVNAQPQDYYRLSQVEIWLAGHA